MSQKFDLENFIQQNRASFDEEVPSENLFAKIENTIWTCAPIAEKKVPVKRLVSWASVFVAASILGVLMVIFKAKDAALKEVDNHTTIAKILPKKAPFHPLNTAVSSNNVLVNMHIHQNTNTASITLPISLGCLDNENMANQVIDTAHEALLSMLDDTLSVFNRLQAILDISQSVVLDTNKMVIARLANILQSDESRNVRLAALDVLREFKQNHEAQQAILHSVSVNQDPAVLASILDNLKISATSPINDSLVKIVKNPTASPVIRDQASFALLASNHSL